MNLHRVVLVTMISNMPMDLDMEVLEAIANNHNLEAGALHLVKATSGDFLYLLDEQTTERESLMLEG